MAEGVNIPGTAFKLDASSEASKATSSFGPAADINQFLVHLKHRM
jgi:hypothetical protein